MLCATLTVGFVGEGSAAQQAGLKPGDELKALNGTKLTSWERLVDVIVESPGERISLDILRDGQPLPSNQAAVFHRTNNTLNRLKLNPTKLATCVDSMGKSLSKGFVEEVPVSEEAAPPGSVWFLPTFAVDQHKKEKVRLVYDASLK